MEVVEPLETTKPSGCVLLHLGRVKLLAATFQTVGAELVKINPYLVACFTFYFNERTLCFLGGGFLPPSLLLVSLPDALKPPTGFAFLRSDITASSLCTLVSRRLTSRLGSFRSFKI